MQFSLGKAGRYSARLWRRVRRHPLARIGPGLITGVADDDPGGIATYSQAGARFGFELLWTMPFAFPLMAAVQTVCATIGRVTGKGLAANIRSQFPPGVLYLTVALLVIANTLHGPFWVIEYRRHRFLDPLIIDELCVVAHCYQCSVDHWLLDQGLTL
jgi:hypothetical protein